MPQKFLRRAVCGLTAFALISCPCAALAQSDSGSALAPIESALEHLRSEASQWLTSLRVRLTAAEPTAEASNQDAKRLIPGGQNIGVAMVCEGVLVVGTSDPGAAQSPARLAGIRSGDRITHVNDVPVVGADQFSEMIAGGEAVTLTVCRDETARTVDLQPVLDASDGEYRIGAWVRDSTAGIGTLTYVDPESGTFGALGHPIQDADTYATLPVAEGLLFDSDVVSIRRGEAGAPGELVGSFMDTAVSIGEIDCNTACGIFGSFAADYDEADAIPIAHSDEICVGAAQILTTLDGGDPQSFDIQITRIYADSGASSRSMMIEVTDPELLARTGGIVQGMSGSPIIQDGKLAGAVTHVLVNDPTMGYGIFIENMLDAAS